ncbi:sulfuric ester hydrolase [Aureococcus anophagefferens]|nr:sulfuric ester hydrolase [Aureococcus anophagefferens]
MAGGHDPMAAEAAPLLDDDAADAPDVAEAVDDKEEAPEAPQPVSLWYRVGIPAVTLTLMLLIFSTMGARKQLGDNVFEARRNNNASALAAAASADDRPHVFLIVADDLGYGDVSYNGDGSLTNAVATPYLDRLAADGITLTRFYSQCDCTPARAALLTGRYPSNTGMQHEVVTAQSQWSLPHEFALLPSALPEGYRKHAIGKWDAVHQPLAADAALVKRGAFLDESDAARSTFAAVALELDRAVERFVEFTKARGAYDDAVFFFMSDNGATLAQSGGGSNWPLRGSKFTAYEGGVRVPAFLHSARVPPARRGAAHAGLFHVYFNESYLFDVVEDPSERTDLRAAMPEKYAELVDAFRDATAAARETQYVADCSEAAGGDCDALYETWIHDGACLVSPWL